MKNNYQTTILILYILYNFY